MIRGESMWVDWLKSPYRPGFYFVSFMAAGFYLQVAYAVVDDFGNLVQVP